MRRESLLEGATFLNTTHSNTDGDLCYEVFRYNGDDDDDDDFS